MEKFIEFGLSYTPKKSNDVLESTNVFLQNNPKIKEKYSQVNWAYQSISKIIPQTTENFWSGHIFPYQESWDEFQISFNLVLSGLYKQAFVSLRSGLELGLLSVYYNINDEGHNTVKDWLKSKNSWDANTPKADKIWKILNSHKNIFEFNKKFNLKNKFDDLSFLHNYVHTKGYKYSNRLGLLKSNCQTFEEKILLQWFDTYEQIVILLISLHMLKYPISTMEFDWGKKTGIDNPYPVLETYEIEAITLLLSERFITEIRNIAKNDQQTQELFNHIINIPDMTEEEKELQIIQLYKSMIEMGDGFIQWEKSQLKQIEYFEKIGNLSNQEKEKILSRIQILKIWATENNMFKSKLERLEE